MRDSIQGMVKIWETKATATRNSKQLARHSWDVVNPGLDKPEKEAVVPKEFEHPRRTVQDVAVGPQGRRYMRTRQTGFFILLRWLIGFFLPQL